MLKIYGLPDLKTAKAKNKLVNGYMYPLYSPKTKGIELTDDLVLRFRVFSGSSFSSSSMLHSTLYNIIKYSNLTTFNDFKIYLSYSIVPNTVVIFKGEELCGVYYFPSYIRHLVSNTGVFVDISSDNDKSLFTYKINFKDFGVEVSNYDNTGYF